MLTGYLWSSLAGNNIQIIKIQKWYQPRILSKIPSKKREWTTTKWEKVGLATIAIGSKVKIYLDNKEICPAEVISFTINGKKGPMATIRWTEDNSEQTVSIQTIDSVETDQTRDNCGKS